MASRVESSPKSAPGQTQTNAALSPVRMFAGLALKGVEGMIEAQKSMLDLAGQQSAATLKAAREGLSAGPAAPAAAVLDMASQTIGRTIDFQKSLLDLGARQTAMALNVMEEQSWSALPKAGGSAIDVVKEVGETMIHAQRIMFDFAVKQNELAAAMLRPAGFWMASPGKSVAEQVRQGIDAVLNAQKQLIEAASKPMKAFAAKDI